MSETDETKPKVKARRRTKKSGPKALGVKRGPLSKQERLYVDTHRDTTKIEAMALHLNRPVAAIENYIENSEGVPIERHATIADALRRSLDWQRYQEEFTPKELEFFVHKYVQMMTQFDGDVHSTEETQICQAITLDILSHRVMKEELQARETMDRTHAELTELYKEKTALQEDGNKVALKKVTDRILILENIYASSQATVKILAQRYEGYLSKHQGITKDIKGTRDQRVKVFENSRQSFLGLLRSLRDEKFRKEAGDEAEMVRLATLAEEKRLKQPHKFEDGVEDPPYYTPD